MEAEQDDDFDVSIAASFTSCLDLLQQNFQAQSEMRQLRISELTKENAQLTEQLNQVLADNARLNGERQELEQRLAICENQVLTYKAGPVVASQGSAYEEAIASLNEELAAKMEECRAKAKLRGLQHLIAPVDWAAGLLLKDAVDVPVSWDESNRFDSVNRIWKLL